MERLLLQEKRAGCNYIVEIKNEIFHGYPYTLGDTEVFTYTIYRRKGDKTALEQEGMLVNRRLKPSQSPFYKYCEALADFYGCKVRHVSTQN